MNDRVRNSLAPTGRLRVAVNLRNFLLVASLADNGEPIGVAADIARQIAERLQLALDFVLYDGPRQLVDAAADRQWDIGLIAIEPQRARHIAFTTAYAEIEATYLVPTDSPLQSIEDVDQPAVTIASMTGSGFGLWLERNIRRASLIRADSHEAALSLFDTNKLDALAGLRPRLLNYQQQLTDTRLLEGNFTTIQQAIGVANGTPDAVAYLQGIVEELKATGFVAQSIARHRVRGLSVAALGGGT